MSVDNKSNRENLPAEFNGTQRNTQLANTNPFGIQLAGAPARMEEIRENEISLRDIWRLVLKHKWLLVTITIVGLILALLISLIRTPIYQASTTLQIGQRAPKVVQFEICAFVRSVCSERASRDDRRCSFDDGCNALPSVSFSHP